MSEAEFIAALEKYLNEKVKADEFSGAVLVAKNGKPIFQKAYGLASKEHNVANRLDTKFNLGSINKLFTQVAIGQLADQGKLSLEDHLSKFIPDYPNRDAANKITVRHLLTMSSGVGDIFGNQFDETPKDKLRKLQDFLPLFAGEPLAFEPGTQQRYSNGGYVLLGLIIEKVSGQSYYDYVRENIFRVAGMENTESFEADTIVPNIASGYTREGSASRVWKNNIYSRPARGSSAGGGYSTAEDMLKFTIAVASGKLRVPDYRGAAAGSPASSSSNGPAPFGFAGGAPGINAIVLFNPASGYTTVVMSNYDEPSAETVGKQIRDWLRGVK
jgi:CubicO group peptidase (beta-lactamase class C family)